MDSLKTITMGFCYGLWDSIKGMTCIFNIDAERHRKRAEIEADRQQRLIEKQSRLHRSPSPVPSSASAMYEEELQRERAAMRVENPDERSLDTMRKKQKRAEPRIPFKERKIALQVLQCSLLNGGFALFGIIIVERTAIPLARLFVRWCYGNNSEGSNAAWDDIQHVLYFEYIVGWIFPLFLLSKIINTLWFTDIANEAYKVRKGKPNLIPNISKLVADFLFNVLVQTIFLGQSMLVSLLPFPFVGTILYLLHITLLYSLYSFEYKWFNMGWELHRRFNYIEINWPYFMGFGVPLMVLTNMFSSICTSSFIFSIFFPLFILSGNEAKPIIGTTNVPLRLFSPAIYISNFIFGGSRNKITANQTAQQKQQYQQQHNNHHQQTHIKQDRQLPSRSSAMDKSPTPSSTTSQTSTQLRYPQPPQRVSPARFTSDQIRSDRSRTQIRYTEGTRTLIPTPVPGTPGLIRPNANVQVKSTSGKQR